MCGVDTYQLYLDLANELLDRRVSERALPKVAARFPSLDEKLLNRLAQGSEDAALSEPRRSWAIAKVTDVAANSQHCDLFVQSMAAWYLGRASNHWGQPKRVAAAIARARRGFVKLNKIGWAAACEWQLNALPWTKPDFTLAAKKLEQALESLENAGFDEFVPHCRLSLAYAQILIGKFHDARENILNSEVVFAALGEHINQARCWLHEASLLRRQGQLDEAFGKLEQALKVFENENAPIDVAKVYYQVALGHLLRTDDLSATATLFKMAADLFSVHDLDLWQAQCINNLGYIYLLSGDLAIANKHFMQAREIYLRHEVLGLLADNLNDSGKLNLLRGKPSISIKQFEQAEELNEKLGSRLSTAIVITNLGEAYGLVGRYQDALHHLERASEHLKSLNNFIRLGACEKFTALIWAQLGQPIVALGHLDKAAIYHEEAKQNALLSSIYNYRASILFEQGEHATAIDYLEIALNIAEKYGVQPQAALARRLLGEALSRIGRDDEALNYLEQSKSSFAEMSMTMEHAASLVALGACYVQLSEQRKAQAAYEEALRLSEGAFPEVDWRAHTGLADLAEYQANIQMAMSAYRQGIGAFTKVRRNFWQPALAGSYLQAPSRIFDKAIVLAAKAEYHQDALQFIESYKASTLLRQLSASNVFVDPKSQELDDLRAEINWLQEQLRASFDQPTTLKHALQSRQIRTQLIEKARKYDVLKARCERQSLSDKTTTTLPHTFNLHLFRELVTNVLGKNWVALDYFIAESQLVMVIITPDNCQVHSSTISARVIMALEACMKARRNSIPPHLNDLNILGDLLIPSFVAKHLTTDTYMLVAPHKELHGIPWAAIQPSFASKPMVCMCIPSVVPSFHSLILLCERASLRVAQSRDSGLLVGLSDFNGLRIDLPHVKDEINALYLKLGPNGHLLFEKDATWVKLVKLSNKEKQLHPQKGLARFAWMHIASHFFSDTHTGRLSGIALRDGDIWLDQLRDLAPLPDLVTFSACNSIYSFVYEGDEHVGLPATCLTAEANSVVGSTWPILDNAASEFSTAFYSYYLEGLSPAQALTQVQRQIIERGDKINNWASFVCVGIP